MGEANSLLRVIVVLGIVLILAGLLYSGAQSGWDNFTSAVRNTPAFNNPFQSSSVIYSFGWASGGSGYENRVLKKGTAHNCQASYPNCIVDPDGQDGNLSYLEMNDDDAGSAEFLSLNITGLPSAGELRHGTLNIWCRANETSDVPINVVIHEYIPSSGGAGNEYLGSLASQYYCIPGTGFRLDVVDLRPDIVRNLNANANPPNLQMWVSGLHGKSWHTTKLTLYLEIAAVGCTGTDFFSNIGCGFANFAGTVVNVLLFIVNFFIFIGALILYLAGIANAFFGMLGFLFAIPDAPGIVQTLISVLVIGMFGWLAFVFIRTVRGSGAVG